MLTAVTNSLKATLTITGVENWDYWGSSPDRDFPIVGAVWPVEVISTGNMSAATYFVSAAFWGENLSSIHLPLDKFVETAISLFGQNRPCPSELAARGMSAALEGSINIGTPNTSAASSIGPHVGGLWVTCSFTLKVTING